MILIEREILEIGTVRADRNISFENIFLDFENILEFTFLKNIEINPILRIHIRNKNMHVDSYILRRNKNAH